MIDTVFIHDIHTESIIGIFPEEKTAPQPLIISVELGTGFAKAASNDDIKYALDYDVISRRIDAFVRETRVELLETLAERLCNMLFDEFSVQQITLTITKPNAIALTQSVGVKLQRTR